MFFCGGNAIGIFGLEKDLMTLIVSDFQTDGAVRGVNRFEFAREDGSLESLLSDSQCQSLTEDHAFQLGRLRRLTQNR